MISTMLSPEIVTVASVAGRCDSCTAAARAEIALTSGGALAFCGHHANKHAGKLARIAARITVEDGFEWAGQSRPAVTT